MDVYDEMGVKEWTNVLLELIQHNLNWLGIGAILDWTITPLGAKNKNSSQVALCQWCLVLRSLVF